MSSDLLPTSADETLISSPPRELDTDDTIARLYFGSPKSPEKRMIKNMLKNDDDTPRRRSARLATPQPIHTPSPIPALQTIGRQAVFVETDLLEKDQSGRDTPDNNQDMQDEPSSALADRISRAHDNPSPPPNLQRALIDETESASPVLRQLRDLSPEIPDSPLPPPIETLSIAVTEAVVLEEAVGDASDLISFATPSSTPPSLQQPPAAGSPPLQTVDDLLSRSPSPPGVEASTVQVPVQSPSPPQIDCPSEDNGKSTLPPPTETTTDVSNQPLQPLPSLLPVHVTSESHSQLSPLRRSKRHSSSPVRSNPLPTKGFSTPLKPITPLRLPSSSQTGKVQTKAMGSLMPITDREKESLMAIDEEERQGRKRRRQTGDATAGVGRLVSLSPESTSVLQQLLPKPTSESDAGPSISKPLSTSIQPLRAPVFPQFGVPSTPSKLRGTFGDVTRTPVRRVPIAPSPGQSGIRSFGGTSFKTQSLDDPNRSPVRRILVTDVGSSPRKEGRNPAVFSRERSGSAELRPAFKTARSASAEPVFSRPSKASSSFNSKATTTLPYPITPKPNAIPEEDEDSLPSPIKARATSAPPSPLKARVTSAPPIVPQTPVKSGLRQPTVSSRIPRMGAKPYARPPAAERSKLPVPASRMQAPTPPARPLGRAGPSNGSSSDDARLNTTQASALKRKREAESKPSPSIKPQPQMVVMRQVPGIRAHERVQKATPPIIHDEQNTLPSSDDMAPTTLADPNSGDSEELLERKTRSAVKVSEPPESSLRTSARTRTRDIGAPQDSGVRRTARSRKAVSSNGDVFSGNDSAPVLPQPLRLAPKRRTLPSEPGYAGLSSLALKTLTTNNTARNQQVMNMLETELVRKEGKRPESPTTKLRTISEKQQAEKTQQREERAARRARKIELGEIGEGDADMSFMSDYLPMDEDGLPLKHRRGPGDDEDYETPERPARPSKRTRIDTDEEETAAEKERRVQWDRGLFTAVYLDELPDNRSWPKNENAGKSCLAKAAKTARLDPLGNLQNADAPVTQIITERVVVKRFVYQGEGEEEAEPEEPEEAEYVPEIKPLRVKAKGRKARS